jgi:ATP-dependent DNA helicase RecG
MISSKSVQQLIAELNETDETEHLEAKTVADGTVGKSVFETICALSNEPALEGGTILLGVEREEALFPLYEPTGVADPERACADIATGCASMFNNPVRVDISVEKVGQGRIVRIDVPELQAHQKPLYFTSMGLPRGAYRRIGPTDHKCTDEDLLLFFHGKENKAYDITVVDDASWDDIDPTAIEAYREFRRKANPLAEELRWSDEDLVYSLGGLRRLDGTTKITITGLVAFGKPAALRRIFPSHRVDYVRVPSTQWVRDIGKEFDAVELRGPLMTVVSRIIATILDDLPRAFRFDAGIATGQRSDMPVLPVNVIREAVVNSLIHRNYQYAQPVQIIRYSNRVEFRNPGYSLKSADRFDEPASVMRNPHIAEVMHETRFAETKGSGIRRMRQFMEESGLSSPTFDSNRESDQFAAIFLFHHFLGPDDWDWLGLFQDFDLTDDQRRALIFVRELGAIDNQAYRSFAKADTLEASKVLRKLTQLELVAKRGSSIHTYYVAGPEMLKRAQTLQTPRVNSIDSVERLVESPHKSLDSNEPIDVENVPGTLRKDVKSIQLGRRLTPEIAQAVFVGLCSWKPLSGAQIGTLLGMNHSYLKHAYLSVLVRDGHLRYLYPDQPNHPAQKYVGSATKERAHRRSRST